METRETTQEVFPFEFTGNGWEYFKIWIVNVFLSVITLGIYSAWAKVRTKRYFYGNTLVDGSAFNYTADPMRILIGRIIAIAALIAYQICHRFFPQIASYMLMTFILILPIIYIMSLTFQMRYTEWRGINFNLIHDYGNAYLLFLPIILFFAVLTLLPGYLGVQELLYGNGGGEAVESSETSGKLGLYFGILGIGGLVGFLLFPCWQRFYYEFVGNRLSFGFSTFSFQSDTWSFYKIYLGALAIVLLGIFAFGFLFATAPSEGEESFTLPVAGPSMFLISLAPAAIYFLALAWIRAKLTNTVYSNIKLREVSVESRLDVVTVAFILFTNTLAIIFSLGLAIPWARVRMAKYRAERTRLHANNLEGFIGEVNADVNANADAISDIFNLDLGL